MIQWAQKQKGFTIVELLIVVVVIAILAAITIVAYNGINNRAKDAAVRSAAEQVLKKVSTYAITNADTYPSTLMDADIQNSGGTSYQYSVNNATNPKTFCVTATQDTISYFVSNSQGSPQLGGCDGHGVGGVAAITNFYLDPKPNSTSRATSWDGGNTGTSYTNVAATGNWSKSTRANRLVFPATITSNNGGFTVNIGSSYLSYAGTKYTIVASIQRISGNAGIGGVSVDKSIAGSGTMTLHASGGTVSSMSIGQTYKVYATFTADAAAADPGQNLRLYVNISNKSANTTVEIADIDLYPGDYTASRNWYSGDSANWVWNGAANSATSTGPAL